MTFVLEEIRDKLHDKAEELQIEGISALRYWLARMDLDEDEFIEYSSERCKFVGSAEADLASAIMAIYADALVTGYIMGRQRRGDWLPS